MALRDVAGVLNGLKKIAAAVYVESARELERTLGSSSGLGSSLFRSASEAGRGWSEYGWTRWTRRQCSGGSSSRGGLDVEFFPEWGEVEEGLFPTTLSGPDSLSGSRTVSSVAEVVEEESKNPPPFPPPPVGSLGNGRSYHTFAASHTHLSRLPSRGVCSRWQRRFHSSTRSGNETVVGGGPSSTESLDSAKRKSPKPKQKVKNHGVYNVCVVPTVHGR